MKKMMLFIGIVFLLAACSPQTFVPPDACVDQPSLILDATKGDPRVLDKSLLAGQFGAIQIIPGYSADDAHAVVQNIRGEVLKTQGMTYAQLVGMVLSKVEQANALAGAAIFIIGPDIQVLNKPIPISTCDAALVLKHLDRQDVLIDIATSGK
jgi:hypothetical protein